MDRPSLAQVTEAALRLTKEECVELAEELRVSPLDHAAEVAQSWIAEAQRRLADLRAGRTEGIPCEEGLAQVRARLRACRGWMMDRQVAPVGFDEAAQYLRGGGLEREGGRE